MMSKCVFLHSPEGCRGRVALYDRTDARGSTDRVWYCEEGARAACADGFSLQEVAEDGTGGSHGRVAAFIEEIVGVCRKHGLVISHRDDCSGLEVADTQLEIGIEWLRQATDATVGLRHGKVTDEKQTPPAEGA